MMETVGGEVMEVCVAVAVCCRYGAEVCVGCESWECRAETRVCHAHEARERGILPDEQEDGMVDARQKGRHARRGVRRVKLSGQTCNNVSHSGLVSATMTMALRMHFSSQITLMLAIHVYVPDMKDKGFPPCIFTCSCTTVEWGPRNFGLY